jgi:hypothetical protein
MAEFRETLKYDANQLAFIEERKAGKLRRKLTLLDETRAKLKFDLDNAASAAARVHRYQPFIDETPQCPLCWILRAKHEPIVGERSGRAFKCGQCRYEVRFDG